MVHAFGLNPAHRFLVKTTLDKACFPVVLSR